MAAIQELKCRISAIDATSFTLVPIVGQGTAGALVDGGAAAGGSDIASGINTIQVVSTGAPDTTFAKYINQRANVSIEMEG